MEKKTKKPSSQLMKQVILLDCRSKPFVSWVIRMRLNAIKHLPGIEDLINKVWKRFVMLNLLMNKYPRIKNVIIYTLASLPKNNWMTFLDKLNTSNKEEQNMLHIHLFPMLLQELTSKERDFKPFWNLAFKELSENLLSPTEIVCQGLDLTLLRPSLKKQEESLQFLTMNKISLQNKNSLKTYYPSYISTVADKWEKEAIKQPSLKSLRLKIKPTKQQRNIIDEWINTSRYVYNKTIALINKGHPINHFDLRDKLVTENTKKNNIKYKDFLQDIVNLTLDKKGLVEQLKSIEKTTPEYIAISEKIKNQTLLIEEKKATRTTMAKTLKSEKNTDINDWELNTPKAVRDGAVNDVCKAYKTGFANLKLGNIKYFRLHFKKKTSPDKCVCVPKSLVKNKNGVIHLSSQFFKDNCKIPMGKKNKKKYKTLKIENDTRIVKQKDEYWLIVPIPTKCIERTLQYKNYCGIDPGVRTFMTTFGNTECIEYQHNTEQLRLLNNKMDSIKSCRNSRVRSRILKRTFNKIENKKNNLINELHWKVVSDLVKRHDIIFYGDIKTHSIVKNNKNSVLNKNVNDLKFYKFKERLLFKCGEHNKKVVLVNEAYTSQTCSSCGGMYKPKCSKLYECKKCNTIVDRDINASKNILMKGILSL